MFLLNVSAANEKRCCCTQTLYICTVTTSNKKEIPGRCHLFKRSLFVMLTDIQVLALYFERRPSKPPTGNPAGPEAEMKKPDAVACPDESEPTFQVLRLWLFTITTWRHFTARLNQNHAETMMHAFITKIISASSYGWSQTLQPGSSSCYAAASVTAPASCSCQTWNISWPRHKSATRGLRSKFWGRQTYCFFSADLCMNCLHR